MAQAKKRNALTGDSKQEEKNQGEIPVERVQLGVRLEKRMVKVLKAIAEYGDMSLGELLETIVLHSFEGGTAQAFGPEYVKIIREFKRAYRMDYGTHANERFVERIAQ